MLLVELLIVFCIGFFSYWFLTNDDLLAKTIDKCPKKESVVRMAEISNSTSLQKEIKEYSLLRIQDGYYEYEDVLNVLMRKNKDDKS